MSEPYQIDQAEALYLLALLESADGLPELNAAELVALLRNTLLLAQSLNDNCREWLEVTAICDGGMHPYSAEKLNIPTLRGALAAAVAIPRVTCGKMCATCAFRVGSPANQTEATASDIFGCLKEGEVFYCHDVEDPEEEKKPCRGFIEAFRQQKKAFKA